MQTLRRVVNWNASGLAKELIVGGFITVLKSPPTAHIIDKCDVVFSIAMVGAYKGLSRFLD